VIPFFKKRIILWICGHRVAWYGRGGAAGTMKPGTQRPAPVCISAAAEVRGELDFRKTEKWYYCGYFIFPNHPNGLRI
jgi:hypothetical protein